MSFDLPATNIYPPSKGPRRPGGFLSAVEWVNDDKLAARSLTASKSQHLNREVLLTEYVLDADKDTTDSPVWVDNFTYTAYFRRHFSAGEVKAIPESSPGAGDAKSMHAVALSIAQDEFDAAEESNIVRALIAGTSFVDLSPGANPSFKIGFGMLERAGVFAVGGGYSPMILLPVTASAHITDVNMGADIGAAGFTPAGSRVVFSAGATTAAELAALTTTPVALRGYVFGQPYGTRAMLVTGHELGDDFDLGVNDLWVTVEGIFNIGFNGAEQYSCDLVP